MAKTLFPYPDIYIEQFRSRFNLNITKEFVSCMDQQLTSSFESKTGIKPRKRIEIGWAHPSSFIYVKGAVSTYTAELWINNHNNPVTICWDSLSGKTYTPADREIDCNDIRYWLEGLEPLVYMRQLIPHSSVKLDLEDLSFILTVERLGNDAFLYMTLKPSVPTGEAISETDKLINNFNMESVKKNRSEGVIHNWQREHKNGTLIYHLDLGSAGIPALKKILQRISDLNYFTEIKVL